MEFTCECCGYKFLTRRNIIYICPSCKFQHGPYEQADRSSEIMDFVDRLKASQVTVSQFRKEKET